MRSAVQSRPGGGRFPWAVGRGLKSRDEALGDLGGGINAKIREMCGRPCGWRRRGLMMDEAGTRGRGLTCLRPVFENPANRTVATH